MSMQRLAVPLGAIAAVLLFLLVNPWFSPEAGSLANQVVTIGFWVVVPGPPRGAVRAAQGSGR